MESIRSRSNTNKLATKEQSKPPQNEETLITLQVGAELRISNMDNPELELTREPSAADATISYRYDPAREAAYRAVAGSSRGS